MANLRQAIALPCGSTQPLSKPEAMAQTAITQRITTPKEAEDAFNLARTSDPTFFSEWQTNLPDLTEAEKALLDRVRSRSALQPQP